MVLTAFVSSHDQVLHARLTMPRMEAVLTRTLESLPDDATHWSSRGIARASGLSVSTVQRIWHAFGLQPYREGRFKLSTDPDFVDSAHRAGPGAREDAQPGIL